MAGTAGPVVLPLFLTDDADGTFQGCFTDAVLAADIEAAPADYYVNIHSANFPAGAVRGQLGVQAVATAASYINPDTGAATENPNVDPNSECETPDQDDTQAVSSAGGTENNVHNDACLFDSLGLDVDAQVSFPSSGVGVINACPDPDGAGPKTATLSGDGLTCTLSGYQETGMAGDFEYHARVNSEVAGTQTVVFCADPEGNGCDDATISDTITIGWIEPGMVMVMKHLCDPSIQSEADFQATSPTPTPVASVLPDAAIAPSDESGPTAGLAAVLAILALGGLVRVLRCGGGPPNPVSSLRPNLRARSPGRNVRGFGMRSRCAARCC